MAYTKKERLKQGYSLPNEALAIDKEAYVESINVSKIEEIKVEELIIEEITIKTFQDEAKKPQEPVNSESLTSKINSWLNKNYKLLGLDGKGKRLLAGLFIVGWVFSGIYNVQPDEQGIVIRFGKFVDITNPGLHYHLPYPVESVIMPKVTQINQLKLGEAATTKENSRKGQMLTGDENIVEAECTIFWRIKNPEQFLFSVKDPNFTIKVTAESALREIISRTPIQAAMSDKRQQIADQTKDLLQKLLDQDKAGVLITQVQLQRVDPPPAVIDAFNDVQRARADQERARNEAEAYANDIIPRARGEMSRILQDAEAYQDQVTNLAEGDAKGFAALYSSYVKAKDSTSWRLYLESVDEVLKKASKVIIDSSGKGTAPITPYMPISDTKQAPKEVVSERK